MSSVSTDPRVRPSRYRSRWIVTLALIALGGTEALGVGLYYGAERARLHTRAHCEGVVTGSFPAFDYVPCPSMMARTACTTDAPAPTEAETETDREIVLKLLAVRNASSFVLATDRPEGDPPAPEAP
jgi:hypothetical protein